MYDLDDGASDHHYHDSYAGAAGNWHDWQSWGHDYSTGNPNITGWYANLVTCGVYTPVRSEANTVIVLKEGHLRTTLVVLSLAATMSAACASGSTSEGGGVTPNYQNPLIHGVSISMNDVGQDLAFKAIVPTTGTFGTPSKILVDVSNVPQQRSVVFQYNLSPGGLVNVGESIWDGGNWTNYVSSWSGSPTRRRLPARP